MNKKSSKSSKHVELIEGLTKISRAITSDLYLEDILKLIVTVTAEVMRFEICSLMLIDEKKKELVIRATQSISESYIKKPPLKIGEGIAGKVVKEKRPIEVLDVTKDKNYKYKEIASKEKLCSLLCLPLMVKGKAIGAIDVYTSRPHKFTKNEVNILTAVANQAAIVIENTELMVKSRVIEEELKTRKLVERAKGILMKESGMSEAQVYKVIQRKSMDMRKSMREISEAIILTEELKK